MYMIPNIQHKVLEYQKDTNKGNCLMNLGWFIKFIALKTFPHNAFFLYLVYVLCILLLFHMTLHFMSWLNNHTKIYHLIYLFIANIVC